MNNRYSTRTYPVLRKWGWCKQGNLQNAFEIHFTHILSSTRMAKLVQYCKNLYGDLWVQKMNFWTCPQHAFIKFWFGWIASFISLRFISFTSFEYFPNPMPGIFNVVRPEIIGISFEAILFIALLHDDSLRVSSKNVVSHQTRTVSGIITKLLWRNLVQTNYGKSTHNIFWWPSLLVPGVWGILSVTRSVSEINEMWLGSS